MDDGGLADVKVGETRGDSGGAECDPEADAEIGLGGIAGGISCVVAAAGGLAGRGGAVVARLVPFGFAERVLVEPDRLGAAPSNAPLSDRLSIMSSHCAGSSASPFCPASSSRSSSDCASCLVTSTELAIVPVGDTDRAEDKLGGLSGTTGGVERGLTVMDEATESRTVAGNDSLSAFASINIDNSRDEPVAVLTPAKYRGRLAESAVIAAARQNVLSCMGSSRVVLL